MKGAKRWCVQLEAGGSMAWADFSQKGLGLKWIYEGIFLIIRTINR
ncbi:hypothetical protein [Neobacillus sp. YIM B06451]|nr:hypothetical protein [Neobacillus sp. YIM B06451]